LTHLNAGDLQAEGMDPASVLVSKSEGWRPRKEPALELAHQVQVGVAGTGTTHANNHLARPRDGIVDVDQDGVRFPLHEP
jgi:hypothetical protein